MYDSGNIINLIKTKIEKELDANFITDFANELKKCEENKLSIDRSEPKLQFDNSHNIDNISQFLNKYSPMSQGNIFADTKCFISKSLCLFKGLKYISEMTENNQTKQEIYNYLNNLINEINPRNIAQYEILFPYFYFLSNLDILDNEIVGISSFKKYNIQEQLIKIKTNNFDKNNDITWIINFLVNPLNLIHYLEFVLVSCDEFLRYQVIQTSTYLFPKNNSNKISNKNLINFNHNNNHYAKLVDILALMEKSMKLIFFYFRLSISFYSKNNLSVFDLILSSILKSFISFSLEIIVNNQDKIDFSIVSFLLNDYLYTALELQIPPNLSNELYIFSLMSSLITSLKYSTKINLINIFNNFNFINISEETKGKINKNEMISNNETIIFLNLIDCLNFYLNKKYMKGITNCQNSIKLINIDDFILSDFFVFPSAYDIINKTNKNLKEKIYWNYGEICNYIINKKLKYPKIFKGSILLHLINVPDEKALLHNLIQYYYENKKFEKAIVLCEKVLSDLKYISIEEVNQNSIIEGESQINYDIYNLVMLTYIKIKIIQKKYNEAKELSILNYERLTNQNTKLLGYKIEKAYLYKTYTYLGYSLFKLGLISDQDEERKKLFEQARYYFEQANFKQNSNNLNNNNEGSNINSHNSFIIQTNNEYKYYELCTMIYLGKFEEIENFYQSKIINPNNNINYNIKYKNTDEEIKFISLHIINLIGLLQYDKAYQMAKEAIKFFCNKNSNYLYQIYLEYFYIGIYREFMYLDDKNNKFRSKLKTRTEKIANELIDVLKRIMQLLDIKKKKLESEKQSGDNNNKNIQYSSSNLLNVDKDVQDKLIKIYHKDFESNELRFSFNKYSKGQINYNIYLINNIIIKVIKMFSLLCLYLIRIPNIQEFEHINILKSQITEIIEKAFDDSSLYLTISGPEEDAFNNEILFINSIKSMINSNNNNNINKENNIDENLKQVIIHDSTNLEAMKLLIKQLFNKNDLSNVYVFCNKALKINDKEKGMWSLMADYYYLNKDEIKYYECSMKELKNSSKHRNSFLNDILDITL